MATIVHWFERTLAASAEAAAMVCLLLLLTTIFRKRLAPFWRYALWMLLAVKLLLSSIPVSLPDDLLRFPGLAPEHRDRMTAWTSAFPDSGTIRQVWTDSAAAAAETAASQPAFPAFVRIAAIVWLIGAAATVVFILASHLRIAAALKRECHTAAPSDLEEMLLRVRTDSGIRADVRLSLTNAVDSPSLFGLFSPTVLIPRNMIGRLEPSEWEYVLRHELVHLKRKDVWLNLMFALFAAIHWFNPAVWYGMRRMRLEQEEACDAGVLASVGENEKYAACLIKMMEIAVTQRKASTGIGFSSYKDQIARRIVMIRDYKPSKRTVPLWGTVMLTAVALLTLPSAFADGTSSPSALPSSEPSFAMPASGRVSSEYGERIHPVTGETSFHDGIDIAGEQGEEVFAAAAGKIVTAAYDTEHGFAVVIEHDEHWLTEYRHLEAFAVKTGDTVKSGDLIGYMGSTGKSTGPHLHFSLLKDGNDLDPAPYLGEDR